MERDTGLKHAKGVDKRSWSEITKAFDQNWYSTPQAVSDQTQKLAVSAYRQSYMFWREKGREADDAKALALALDDMKMNWGVSSVMGGLFETGPVQTFMPYPPEKMLGEKGKVGGTYDWITEQARNQIAAYVETKGEVMRKLEPRAWPFTLMGTLEQRTHAAKDAALAAPFMLVPNG